MLCRILYCNSLITGAEEEVILSTLEIYNYKKSELKKYIKIFKKIVVI